MDNKNLLEVKNLKTYFFSREGTLRALEDVNFTVAKGEVLGIAGESGCGKSVTMQSIMRILPKNAKITGGEILFRLKDGDDGIVDLVKYDPFGEEIREIRGKEIAMVFQEPMTSFSPVHTIGSQIMEVISLHQGTDKKESKRLAIEMLKKVNMPKPEKQFYAYPFNLSGGMRQRAMIAMALACNPKLLIADEPTSALDATIQAQILELLVKLQKDMGMSVIMITHDLSIIAEMAQKMLIMYLGESIEYGTVENVFYEPKHPYTVGLLAAIPKLGKKSREKLSSIGGVVPSLYERPDGCPFHPRCPKFMSGMCDKIKPSVTDTGGGHMVKCHLYKSREK